MDTRTKVWLIGVVWVLGIGSCLLWGSKHLWVAGLGVIAVSVSGLAYAYLPDVGPRERQQYTIAGMMMLVLGIVLLYIGIRNP